MQQGGLTSPRAAAVWATLCLTSYGGLGNSVGRFNRSSTVYLRHYSQYIMKPL